MITNIEALQAKVDRLQIALEDAQDALYRAQIAPAQYRTEQRVYALRKLRGRPGKVWKPAKVAIIHPADPAHVTPDLIKTYGPQIAEISYSVCWKRQDGDYHGTHERVYESEIRTWDEMTIDPDGTAHPISAPA